MGFVKLEGFVCCRTLAPVGNLADAATTGNGVRTGSRGETGPVKGTALPPPGPGPLLGLFLP